MPYRYLLLNLNWRIKRQEIFYRDNWKCQKCGKEHKTFKKISLEGENNHEKPAFEILPPEEKEILNIHHKVYRQHFLPWEQPNKDYITLCEECHQYWHENNELIILDRFGKKKDNFIECNRCSGTGYLEKYRHIENGICFKCNGLKKIPNYFEQLKHPVYKGRIDYNLKTSDFNFKLITDHLSQDLKEAQLNEFLDRLESIIIKFNLSNFDERFLISPFCPWKKPLDVLLWVQIGLYPKIKYPSSLELEDQLYPIGHGLYLPSKETWLKGVNREIERTRNVIDRRLLKGKLYVYANDFRQLHLPTIYKAAINKTFRHELIKRIKKKQKTKIYR